MSEETKPIAEETVEAQPAADTSDQQEPQAVVDPSKSGKSRRKGKRAAAPEPGPVEGEPSAVEPLREVEASVAGETDAETGEVPVSEEIPAEQAEGARVEGCAADAVDESPPEVAAENPPQEAVPPEPTAEDPAEPETPAEPLKSRKSRKKGKRSEEPATFSEGLSDEGAPASGETGSAEEAGGEEAEAQEVVDPADDGTRHALPLVVEAILFASQKPMTAKELLSVFRGAAEVVKEIPDAPARAFGKIKEPHLREAIESLEIACAAPDRAYEVRESAAGWQLVTKPQYSPWLRQLFPEHRSARLSAPAMETLAIIAYRQPITRADIEAVRGVAVDGVMQTLLDRGLVKIAGRADVPGRPLLYDTTQNFMEHFGLKNLDDLPNAAELRKISLPTAEAPPADPPAAGETPAVAPAASSDALAGTPAGGASAGSFEGTSAETSEAPPAHPEASPTEPAAELAAEPEAGSEISETPLSPEASAEESRPEN